jgi:hypothetical protein
MSAGLPTFSPTAHLPSFGPVGRERLAEAEPRIAKAELETRFQNLALLLERLWMFYEAMRSGKPIENSDEMLAEVRGALTKVKKATASKFDSDHDRSNLVPAG